MKKNSSEDKPTWLSSYDSGVPPHLHYENLCLPEILRRSAEKFPKRLALQFQGFEMNYAELDEMVDVFSTVLSGFGIQKGDRVSILLPNVIPCVVSYYAILRIGAVAVMNCPLYTDEELLHQFNDSHSKLLITLDLLGNRMIDLREKTHIEKIIYTSIGDYLPFPQNFIFPLVAKRKKLAATVKEADNVHKWEELIHSTSKKEIAVNLDFSDDAMFQYTGGTTGRAKGVVLSHGNMSKQVQQVASWFPEFEKGKEVLLGALPFFHVFGLTAAMNFSIFMAWENILIPKPEPSKLLKVIKKFKPTFGPLVPTMYIGMINHPDIHKTDMTCFKGFFSGSAPLPVEILRQFESMTGAVIVEGFGLTESSPVTHINPFRGTRKIGSIGIPIPDTLCKIVDVTDQDKEMQIDEPGELLIKGPQVMQRYHNLEKETASALNEGWLRTGDIALVDNDGYFYIVDRIKDMIISGGFNVYPREIDEVIIQHPQVKEVSSIGVPHSSRGEQIKSFVILHEEANLSEEEIIDFCAKHLAKYKLPTHVEFISELPKTIVGKVLRKELRKREG